MNEHLYRLWLADFCEALAAFRSCKAVLSHYASQPTPLGWPGGRWYTG